MATVNGDSKSIPDKSLNLADTNGTDGNGRTTVDTDTKTDTFAKRMSDIRADSSKSPVGSAESPKTDNNKIKSAKTPPPPKMEKSNSSQNEQETDTKKAGRETEALNGTKTTEENQSKRNSSDQNATKADEEIEESGGIFLTQSLVTPRMVGRSGSDTVTPRTVQVTFQSDEKKDVAKAAKPPVSKSMELVQAENGPKTDDMDVLKTMDDIVKSVDAEMKIVCSVCNKTFTSPRILPCLHSLCFACLDKVLTSPSEDQYFPCPECNEMVPRVSPEFINNVYLEGMLGVSAAKLKENATCDICSLKNMKTPATSQCLDCVDLLCDGCGNAHSSTRATVDHRIVSLQEIATGKHDSEIRKRVRVKCRHHKDEPFESFCKKCNSMVCRECMLIDHRGHECVSLFDAHNTMCVSLRNLMGSVVRKQREISLKRARTETAMTDIDSKEKLLIDYVDNLTQQMIEKLNREREEVVIKLQRHMNVQRTECSDQKSKIDKELHRINSGLSFCHQVMHNGKQDELVFMTPTLKKRLKELSLSPISDEPDVALEIPNVSLTDEYKITEAVDVFEFTPANEDISSSRISKGFGKTMSVSIQYLKRIKIRAPTDILPPDITGVACTDSGSLVVGDKGNSNVKLFSLTGSYVNTLLTCKPVAVAACNDIVCVSDSFSIQLVSTNKTFRRRISVDGLGPMRALTNYQMRYFTFFAPFEQMFKVYDTTGRYVEEFPMAEPRLRNIHRSVMHITSNSKGDMLTSDWGSCSVVHSNKNASALHEYKCASIGCYNNGWKPRGLSVDSYDNVLIADQQNNQLMILSPDFKVIHKRKVKRDKLERPNDIASDFRRGHYYVSGKGDHVNVYMCKYG